MTRVAKQKAGFTLIEMLLVMVIVGILIAMGANYMQQKAASLRMDRTVQQMEQILNAGLAYYINNGKWPEDIDCLYGSGTGTDCSIKYLPYTSGDPMIAPWSSAAYIAGATGSAGNQLLFYV